MTNRPLVFVSMLLLGCGASTTPCPTTPKAAERPASLPRTSPEVIRAVAESLQGAGHSCQLNGDTLICDREKNGTPTVAVVYGTEGTVGPYLGLVSSFTWKDASGCANASKKLVEINGKFDLLHAFCTDENVIFSFTMPMGEAGFTSEDVRHYVTYFQTVVGTVLRSNADLVATLK